MLQTLKEILSVSCYPFNSGYKLPADYSEAMIMGISLRESRKWVELTQHQLSQQTGISQRHISEIENGKRSMNEEMAKKFAKVLLVDYRVFL